jgi:hypothetical protein
MAVGGLMVRLLSLFVLAVVVAASAQESPASRRAQRLRHGVNVSEWFAQTGEVRTRIHAFCELYSS